MNTTTKTSLIDSTRFFLINDYKTVYTEIPKVACTSFKIWISELLGKEFDRSNWEYIHELDLPMISGNSSLNLYPNHFKFCFIRNPWDRLLSCWMSKIKTEDYDDGKNWRKGVENNFWRYGDLFRTEMSFKEFVKSVTQIPDANADAHFRSQYTFFYDNNRNKCVDLVGRFEKIDTHFPYICEIMNAPVTELPHVHKQDRTHYKDYYDSRTADMIRDRYAMDIELFGYSF